jgi:pyroglutamyl-peptidase
VSNVLITGFEPFGGHASNPSSAVAEALEGYTASRYLVRSTVLPVDGVAAPGLLRDLLDELDPAAVLMLGLAEGRPQPSIERVAVNALDYPIADNDGKKRTSEAVCPGGPDAFMSSLPIAAILAAWRESRLPGYLSDSAGTFLCNQVFYAARHHLSRTGRGTVPAGFIHLPCDEDLALEKPRPFVPLDLQVQSVRVALRVTVDGLLV